MKIDLRDITEKNPFLITGKAKTNGQYNAYLLYNMIKDEDQATKKFESIYPKLLNLLSYDSQSNNKH